MPPLLRNVNKAQEVRTTIERRGFGALPLEAIGLPVEDIQRLLQKAAVIINLHQLIERAKAQPESLLPPFLSFEGHLTILSFLFCQP